MSKVIQFVVLTTFLLIGSLIHDASGNSRPDCKNTFYSAEILEGEGDGYLVLTPVCDDPDSGLDGELTYTLADGDKGQFRVDPDNGSVLVEGEADAERLFGGTDQLANPYTISIIVADKGTPPYSTPVTVFVNIKSINDHIPRMDSLPAVVNISESQAVGKIVSTCTLVDEDVDASNHGTAFVRIISGNDDGKFILNQENCDLMLISPLDFEETPSYTLTLEAYDHDPFNPKTSTQNLVVDVLDVNDFRPTCLGYNILREVSESSPVSTTLIRVECFDKDDGLNGQLEYKVSKGDAKLTIDKMSGNVSLVSPLDFEAGDEVLEIEVIVSDLGTPSLSSTVTVVFRVTDADDNPPQWTKPTFNATISESTLVGSIVMTVSATDLDSPNTDLSKITYGLERPCNSDWFLLDALIGSVVVKNALDWETTPLVICEIHAYSSDKYDDRNITTMYIELMDVNDRAPIFSKFLFTGSILENSPPGTHVLTVEADDPDDGINGNFSLSLPDDSTFSINPNTGQVTLTGSVDYENTSIYLLTVIAKDRGTPTQSSLTYINIQVSPINEYDPIISPGISLTISESAEPGTALTKMTADDQDTGEDGEVEFFLLDSNVPFLLESTTGHLRIGTGLDREVREVYNLIIMVKDKSNTTVRSSLATIEVTVIDINDNAPDCELIPPIKISPPADAGDMVVELKCKDEDKTSNIRYTLIGGDTAGIFDVNTINGEVKLTATPVIGSYILYIDVEDNGTPNLKVTIPIAITIEAELKFDTLPATVPLIENTTLLQLIHTVNTSGVWDFVSKEIISGNHDNVFNLNPATGEVKLIGVLDWETYRAYNLKIEAISSHGQVIQSDLIVRVLDINDDVPNFDNPFVHIKIVETIATPVTLQIITATDSDENQNSEVEYHILKGNDDGRFEFDAANATFRLLKGVDYEVDQSYSLTIRARDKGSPSLTSTAVVLVEVVNQDDNPLLVTWEDFGVSLNISEDIAIGTYIAKLNGTDSDLDSNVRFSIVSGNDFGFFIMDKENGSIYTATSLDYEKTHQVALTVEGRNSIGVFKQLTLNMDLIDINDNAPVFSSPLYSVSVAHGTSLGKSIGQVTVSDADSGNNGVINLSIISGNDRNHFRLSGKSIETTVVLDSDIQDFYTLTIEAIDQGTPSKSSSTVFEILVNEQLLRPQFLSSSADLSFSETKSPSTIFDCDATSAGAAEGENGDIEYSITKGNERGFFFIDSLTCRIDLVKTLDFGVLQRFNLSVLAVNKENSLLNDNFEINVNITQVNKRSPKFTQQIYSWMIPENTTPGTTLGNVTATDQDVGEFGEIVYVIEPNSKFEIDSSTGLIKTKDNFDYKLAQSFHYYVTAKDKGQPVVRSSSAIVIITLEDINDYTPTFNSPNYQISISESAIPPLEIHPIFAKDLDTGDAGEVVYTITSGDITKFSIDATSGVLFLMSALDYETKTEYDLEIQAKDNGTPSLSSTAAVKIHVLDYNDNTPEFSIGRVDLALPSSTPSLSSVYNVIATDADNSVRDSTINYFIQEGNSRGLFTIDIDTGEVKTGRMIESGDEQFEIVIVAKDKGSPPLSGTSTIGVLITPTSVSGVYDYDFSVVENGASGLRVGQVTGSPASTITGYSITSGNYNTDLGITNNGLIYTNRPLDRENYSLYQITVSVQHLTTVQTIQVSVTVSDVNDNPPILTATTLVLDMVENTPVGSSIGRLTATDADSGVNKDLTFVISETTPLGQRHFNVDNTGSLTVREIVDYEIFTDITFVVRVSDRGSPSMTSTATVTVNVQDVLEQLIPAPMDDTWSTFKSMEIPDNLGEGDPITVITAQDFNLTLLPTESATFTSMGSNVFTVNPISGQLTLGMESLLYPSSSYLQWVVCTVTDNGNTTSKLAMLRVDTFTVDAHLVAIVVSLDAIDLESKRSMLRNRLQTYFPVPNDVRIWAIETTSTSNRRRLLATESVALVVVVADNTTDNVGGVDQTKNFLTQEQVLSTLQADATGTPVGGLSDATIPVSHVIPYREGETSNTEVHPANIAIFLILGLAGAIAVVLIVALTAYFVIQHRKSKGKLDIRNNPDEEHLYPDSSEEGIEEINLEQQEKALMLMETRLPVKQLPPLETTYGNYPIHSFRPPTMAIKTATGFKRPVTMAPMDTAEKPKMKEPVTTPIKTRSLPKSKNWLKKKALKAKKTKKQSTENLKNDPNLTLTNYSYDIPEDKGDKTDGRKKMMQSVEDEQIQQSKLFLLKMEAQKRQRISEERRKRKVSEQHGKVRENSVVTRPLKPVRKAWRSPKSSKVDAPDKSQLDLALKSPYEQSFQKPYHDKLLKQEKQNGEKEDSGKIDRRKSFAGFDVPDEAKT